jgi:hypothetical protein
MLVVYSAYHLSSSHLKHFKRCGTDGVNLCYVIDLYSMRQRSVDIEKDFRNLPQDDSWQLRTVHKQSYFYVCLNQCYLLLLF